MSTLIIIIIVLVGISIFLNGLTDAPNALAAVISTRVLNPRVAILVGMIFNLLGIFVLGSSVAATIANIADIGTGVEALAALGGAQLSLILWSFVAWRYGIPTSGTHAMVSSLVGAGIGYNGLAAINPAAVNKVLIGMLVSTLAGFAASFLVTKFIEISCKNMRRRPANRIFSIGQIVSVSLITLSNGAQDGQKFMGIIYFALVVGGVYPATIANQIEFPFWVMPLIAVIMTLGISAGGYRVIRRLGMKMVRLEKYQGFSAEIVASVSMIVSTLFGVPLSITHIKGASMMGAGASRGINRVKWNVAKDIVLAWIFTFPICMLLGYAFSTMFRIII